MSVIRASMKSMPLPFTLLPCSRTGDVILIPVGTVHVRLDSGQQRELVAQLMANLGDQAPVSA